MWSRLARCFSSASRCRSHGDTLRVESATASATCGVPDKTLESCGSPCETQELPGPCPRGLSVQYSPRQHRTEAAMPEHHSAPTECRTIQLRPARGQRFGAPACPLIPAPPSDPAPPKISPNLHPVKRNQIVPSNHRVQEMRNPARNHNSLAHVGVATSRGVRRQHKMIKATGPTPMHANSNAMVIGNTQWSAPGLPLYATPSGPYQMPGYVQHSPLSMV